MAESSSTIFISYASVDSEFADRLATDLSKLGITIWIDKSKLKGGQEWAKEIDRAIDEGQTMLVIVSPAAMDSRYVRAEYNYAFAHGKRIIPLLYQQYDLPFPLQSLQWIDFTKDYQGPFAELLDLLQTPFSDQATLPAQQTVPGIESTQTTTIYGGHIGATGTFTGPVHVITAPVPHEHPPPRLLLAISLATLLLLGFSLSMLVITHGSLQLQHTTQLTATTSAGGTSTSSTSNTSPSSHSPTPLSSPGSGTSAPATQVKNTPIPTSPSYPGATDTPTATLTPKPTSPPTATPTPTSTRGPN